MKLYEGFSYKTFYYYLPSDDIFKSTKFKEAVVEDNDGNPLKFLTQESFENIVDNRFNHDDDFLVINTTKGCFVYGSSDLDKIKENLILLSKNSKCAAFGNYRTSDVYCFGEAVNGNLARLFYVDEYNCINIGEESSFEKKHPFSYFDEEGKQINPTREYIDEEYVFDYANNHLNTNMETEDFEVIDVKSYVYCELDGVLDNEIEKQIATNLRKYNIDSIAIFLTHNKKENFITISCENVLDNTSRFSVFADEVYDVNRIKKIKLSFNRCLQAIATKNLNSQNNTLSSMGIVHSRFADKSSSVVCITIDTENKFMIGTNSIKKRGKKIISNKYLPGKNLFYSLDKEIIDKLVNKAIKQLKSFFNFI